VVSYSLVLIYAQEKAWRKFKLPTFVKVYGRLLFEFPEEAPDACDVQVSSPRPPAAARQLPKLVGRSRQVSPCTFLVCGLQPEGWYKLYTRRV
jgi:hypothetical protein